jgi:hypothetical protein
MEGGGTMSDNLLMNPTFGGKYEIQGDGNIRVAPGWQFGYMVAYKRPELLPYSGPGYGGALPKIGLTCQKGFSTFDRSCWWLWQPVPAVKGQWYKGSVWVYQYSTGEGDEDWSADPGKLWTRCGIHPWGEPEILDWSTQYGLALQDVYDKWQKYECYAQAQAGALEAQRLADRRCGTGGRGGTEWGPYAGAATWACEWRRLRGHP